MSFQRERIQEVCDELIAGPHSRDAVIEALRSILATLEEQREAEDQEA